MFDTQTKGITFIMKQRIILGLLCLGLPIFLFACSKTPSTEKEQGDSAVVQSQTQKPTNQNALADHESVPSIPEELPESAHDDSMPEKCFFEQNDAFVVDIAYPTFDIEAFDDTIYGVANAHIDLFKQELSGRKQDENNAAVVQKAMLTGQYDIVEAGQYLSVKFCFYPDFGSAHPTEVIFSVVYDRAREKILTLSDCFDTNSSFLQRLSQLSRKQLLEEIPNIDQFWLNNGTQPNNGNFASFTLASDGIVIYFPAYQVAPYSTGEISLLVDYDQVSDILSITPPLDI